MPSRRRNGCMTTVTSAAANRTVRSNTPPASRDSAQTPWISTGNPAVVRTMTVAKIWTAVNTRSAPIATCRPADALTRAWRIDGHRPASPASMPTAARPSTDNPGNASPSGRRKVSNRSPQSHDQPGAVANACTSAENIEISPSDLTPTPLSLTLRYGSRNGSVMAPTTTAAIENARQVAQSRRRRLAASSYTTYAAANGEKNNK